MAAKLEAALADAGVMFRAETYPAAHGWMMPAFPSTTTMQSSVAGAS